MSFEEEKEQVRAAVDLCALVGETVLLRQRGQEFWGCCPFHQEKTPSFKVNPQTGLWKCFGCGKGGDVFDFIQERENLDFMDALRYLADRANIELTHAFDAENQGAPRKRLKEIHEEAQTFYARVLMRGRSPEAASARNYLAGRKLSSDVCKRWGIGFAPGNRMLTMHLEKRGYSRKEIAEADLGVERAGQLYDRFYNRVMFPIHDEHGSTVAFGGRVIGQGKPKYLNSRDTAIFHKGKQLYAFDRAREHIQALSCAVVCEGYTDVIAMHEAGIKHTVATLGTALTIDHIHAIERCRVSRIVFMFDGDAAGQRAAERAILFVTETKADVRCVILPDNMDPAEFLEKRGVSELIDHLDRARPLIDFVLERRLSSFDLTIPGQRMAALDELSALLAPLKRSFLLDEYATRLADTLGADVEETKRLIKSKTLPALPSSKSASTEDLPVVSSSTSASTGDPSHTRTLQAFSADERAQINIERELLAQMAEHPDDFRQDDLRIASLSWTDARHESIAWAILATPEGSSPAEVVGAASAVIDDAPHILAGGTLDNVSSMSPSEIRVFLLDMAELYSTKRKVRAIRSRLASHNPDDNIDELFEEATRLQKRAQELTFSLQSMNELETNG